MKISISDAKNLTTNVLIKYGYTKSDALLATDLIVEGELVGKSSHGMARLIFMKSMIADGRVVATKESTTVTKETKTSVLVDGKKKPGFMVVPFVFNYVA